MAICIDKQFSACAPAAAALPMKTLCLSLERGREDAKIQPCSPKQSMTMWQCYVYHFRAAEITVMSTFDPRSKRKINTRTHFYASFTCGRTGAPTNPSYRQCTAGRFTKIFCMQQKYRAGMDAGAARPHQRGRCNNNQRNTYKTL